MNRKEVLAFVLTILAVPFVSAAVTPEEAIRQTVEAAKDFFTPIFTALFNTSSTDEFLFAKILLSVLLYVVVNAAVQKINAFKKQKAVPVIIAAVVSIFAVRFISEGDLVQGILLPYGVLGVALTTLLPFLIFFYFVYDSQMGPFGRKIAWIFFGVVFLALWLSRYDELGDVANQIYMWTLIGVIAAWFGDKSIKGYFRSAERKKGESGHIRDRINDLRDRQSVALRTGDNKRWEELQDAIKELEKKL